MEAHSRPSFALIFVLLPLVCRSLWFSDAMDLARDQSSPEMSSGPANLLDNENISTYVPLSLPPNYNKLAIPIRDESDGEGDQYVYAKISIFIRRILSVDEKKEELVLDTDFGMLWVDWKIYDHLNQSNWADPQGKPLGNRILGSDVLKQIWTPNVYIDEMADVRRTSILSNLITLNFLADTGDSNRGDIVYSARTTLKLRCGMSFEYYPADIQTCKYHLRSYSYPTEQLELRWANGKGIYLDDPANPNFDLQISSVEPHKKLRSLVIEELFDAYRRRNYSALLFVIKARRKLSYHIVQTYLPSSLLILITWLCFLLPSNMVEARIGISMTTALTLTAMFAAVREQSPNVSYTMAIDIWMVFCIFFVFLALTLFTVIHWMELRLKRMQESKEEESDSESNCYPPLPRKEKYTLVVRLTKRYAFWAFATTFVIFLVSYWIWLLASSKYFYWKPKPDYNGGQHVDGNGNSSNLYRYHPVKNRPNTSAFDDDGSSDFLNFTLENN